MTIIVNLGWMKYLTWGEEENANVTECIFYLLIAFWKHV